MKKALITGITGQDGSYLLPFLLQKGYEVHGIKRYSSNINTPRIDEHFTNPNFHLHHGDLTDSGSLHEVLAKVQPDEVYNLAALSHVKVSFTEEEMTFNVNAMGTLRLLKTIRNLGMVNQVKFYQASTSEMFGGLPSTAPQTEDTPFHPRSPYGVSKVAAHHAVVNYREAYDMYACNGILFNHESPVRGETFVTRKVTRGIAALLLGKIDCIKLGNLDAKRDWGHARDYVQAMWLMLQQDKPDDYVIATGNTITIRKMVQLAFEQVGISLLWYGNGEKEKAYIRGVDWTKYMGEFDLDPKHTSSNNPDMDKIVIRVDPQYYRPAEVDLLVGDATKAKNELGWQPTCNLADMLKEMIIYDIKHISKYGY